MINKHDYHPKSVSSFNNECLEFKITSMRSMIDITSQKNNLKLKIMIY